MAFLQSGLNMPESKSSPIRVDPPSNDRRSHMTSQRSLKQLGLFMGGAFFLGISSIITRRALVRKYHRTMPKFYTHSNEGGTNVNGPVEALEALTIATGYVFSGALMLVGGTLWACDISTIEECRTALRKQMGVEVGPGGDAESDKEIEEWMVSILAKKEMKEMAKEMAKGPPPGLLEKYAQPKDEK